LLPKSNRMISPSSRRKSCSDHWSASISAECGEDLAPLFCAASVNLVALGLGELTELVD
jgi:hypothetical protein